MRFMVIVKATQDSEAGKMPSRELIEAMGRFNEELVKDGVLLAADGLYPSSGGARIQFGKDGKRSVIDGPFAETKELIAGYWMVQARSKEEVLERFQRCPAPHEGVETHIEIRRAIEPTDFPPEVFPPEAAAHEQHMRDELAAKAAKS